MANKARHLTKEEKFFIEKMLRSFASITKIAKLLDRGVSTISEEVKRNRGMKLYRAKGSESRANSKQKFKKFFYNKVLMNRKLRKFVDKNVSLRVSPEKLSGLLKKRPTFGYASAKSIRKYLKIKPLIKSYYSID